MSSKRQLTAPFSATTSAAAIQKPEHRPINCEKLNPGKMPRVFKEQIPGTEREESFEAK